MISKVSGHTQGRNRDFVNPNISEPIGDLGRLVGFTMGPEGELVLPGFSGHLLNVGQAFRFI